jgi:putative transposase
MKHRFTEEQIIGVLKEAEADLKVKDLCRQHNATEQTYFRWKSKHGGMSVSEMRCLKELESENARLKKIVTEKEHRIDALKEVVKKVLSPQQRRPAIEDLKLHNISERVACSLIGLPRSTCRYMPSPDHLNEKIRVRMKEIAF